MSETGITPHRPHSFRAIVWKELHEGAKWSAIGLLAMAAGLTYALHEQSAQTSYPGRGVGSSLLYSTFLTVTTFGSAIVGLMIGLSQTIPENRGDQWGFLVHRPVNRSTLFVGKVIAALMLYCVAVGVPLGCAVAWASVPGHMPSPFEPRMALPGLADLLCGVIYYFAGLLTGMREARWFGSRAFGVGFAIICSLAAGAASEFWQAAIIISVGAIVMAVAAWGGFIAGGRDSRQPMIARLAGGLAIGAGWLITGGVAMVIVLTLLQGRAEVLRFTQYEPVRDGTLVQAVYEGNVIVAVNDMDGHPLKQYMDIASRSRDELFAGLVSAGVQLTVARSNTKYITYRMPYRYFTGIDADAETEGPISWCYVHELGLVAGYENRTSDLVGWIGPDGFSPAGAMPGHRFQGPLLTSWTELRQTTLPFADGVYRVGFKSRQVQKIFSATPAEPVIAANEAQPDASMLISFGERSQFSLIATTKTIHLQSRSGVEQLAVPVDPQAVRYGYLAVVRPLMAKDDVHFFEYQPRGGDLPESQWWMIPEQLTLYRTGQGGPLTSTHYAVSQGWNIPQTAWPEVIAPSLLVPGVAQVAADVAKYVTGTEYDITANTPAQQTAGWVCAIISAVACSLFALIRGRAFSFTRGRLVFWTILATLLGPLGVAMMLSLLDWPARERCPGCGRWRIVTNDRCEHCQAAFPPPAMDGTEIFEPLAA